MAETLLNRGQNITIQWIPSHIGLAGNERADRLAYEALKHELRVPAVPDPKRTGTQAVGMLKAVLSRALEKRLPFPTRNLSRRQTSLLYRLRTGSAYTREWLFGIGKTDDPNCEQCGEPENIQHVLLECPHYDEARDNCLISRVHDSVPDPLKKILTPQGNASSRRQQQRQLLKFLEQTTLALRL